MAEAKTAVDAAGFDPKEQERQIKDQKRQLKREQKAQKKEAKKRAKEIEEAEERLEEEGVMSGGVPVIMVTLLIVIVWVGILALLIKLDVGGFGSGVLAPVLKDVPVVNMILPGSSVMAPGSEGAPEEAYGGYTSLEEAVEQIKILELELEAANNSGTTNSETIATLEAEVERLRTFEAQQVEFERIKDQFYNEVVYSDKGPGIDEYRKYYESIDPENAEYLYKQVVEQEEIDSRVTKYANTYAGMKPKAAAEIFDDLVAEGSIDLVAKILGAMGTDNRGAILAQMDVDNAARVTKLMDPGY